MDYDALIELVKKEPLNVRIAMMASFKVFIKTMFFAVNSSKIIIKPFHEILIKKLQDLVFQKNERRNLLINVPVGAGKSLIVQLFICWCFYRSVNNAFIYCSHSDTLIRKLSKESRDICEHPVFVLSSGHILKKDTQSATNWAFEGSKTRMGLMAGTTGGSITGLDAGSPNVEGFSGALIIDDPMDASAARYERARQEVKDYYIQKLKTRRRTPQTPTILVMQRLHKEDLSGYVLDTEPDRWEHISIPALNDDGTSFWEEKDPAERLKKLREIEPFVFSGQYQQKPMVLGGTVIKVEWFPFYKTYADKKPIKLFFVGDTAQKVKENNDYTVFTFWGLFDDKRLYLIDLIRGKWESPDLKKYAKEFWNKWKGGINNRLTSGFYVEDKVSGTSLIQDLKYEAGIPMLPFEPAKDKLTRIQDALPYIESGMVMLPFYETYSFNTILLAECEAFQRDMSHKHDDICDCISAAIKIAFGAGGYTLQQIVG